MMSKTHRTDKIGGMQAVQRIILDDMVETYSPQPSDKATERIIGKFKEFLWEYSDDVLEEAWVNVQKHKMRTRYWPAVSLLVDECENVASELEAKRRASERKRRRLEAELSAGSVEELDLMPWERREKQVQLHVDRYMRRFREKSPLYRDASEQGWVCALVRYVGDVATLQAQMIMQSPNIRIPAGIIPQDGSVKDTGTFLKMFRDQYGLNMSESPPRIEVHVPQKLIEQWQRGAVLNAESPPRVGNKTVKDLLEGVQERMGLNNGKEWYPPTPRLA